jgi:hypothetical protein
MSCKTCVFNGSYGPSEEHRVVKQALAEGTFVKCHDKPKQGSPVCKGFDAAYPNASLMQRLITIGSLNGITE